MEAGVGTGKNMTYYPDNIAITAIDLTPGMIKRARRRTAENVRQSGWQLEYVKDMGMKGVFKMLVATTGALPPASS